MSTPPPDSCGTSTCCWNNMSTAQTFFELVTVKGHCRMFTFILTKHIYSALNRGCSMIRMTDVHCALFGHRDPNEQWRGGQYLVSIISIWLLFSLESIETWCARMVMIREFLSIKHQTFWCPSKNLDKVARERHGARFLSRVCGPSLLCFPSSFPHDRSEFRVHLSLFYPHRTTRRPLKGERI